MLPGEVAQNVSVTGWPPVSESAERGERPRQARRRTAGGPEGVGRAAAARRSTASAVTARGWSPAAVPVGGREGVHRRGVVRLARVQPGRRELRLVRRVREV